MFNFLDITLKFYATALLTRENLYYFLKKMFFLIPSYGVGRKSR